MAGGKSGSLGAAATVVLTILPLWAGAQTVDTSWKPATPLRLIDSFEDSDADRERRRAVSAQFDLLSEVRGRTVFDVLVGLPNGMMDWVTGGLRSGPDRDEVISMLSLENRMLLSRLLSCPIDDASAHPFDDLVGQFLTREQRYFARFQSSAFSAAADEGCLEDIDSADLLEDQRNILFAVGRKLCSGSIGLRLDDRLRDEAFDIASWHPVDFAVAPAVVAGYLYVLGWDKKVELLGLRCAFQIEPIRRILERFEGSNGDMVSAATMEIGVGKFPVKAILSLGIMDGDALIDFVGIGTSLGQVKQAVTRALLSQERDE
jgi:hypothetical protein